MLGTQSCHCMSEDADLQGWRFSTFVGISSKEKSFSSCPAQAAHTASCGHCPFVHFWHQQEEVLSLERATSVPICAHSPPAGTFCLWIFWPSFASATTTHDSAEPWAVLNLYFSMAASTLATFVLSPILYEEGTLQVVGPVLRQSQALVHPAGTGSMTMSKGAQGDAGLLSWVG